jgi:hypothetical protein
MNYKNWFKDNIRFICKYSIFWNLEICGLLNKKELITREITEENNKEIPMYWVSFFFLNVQQNYLHFLMSYTSHILFQSF